MSKRLRVSMEVISGIYEIENLVNGNKYVGSSKDIYERWVQHQRELRKEKHYNEHLQRAWKKYGEDNFVFRILEITPDTIKDRFEREQYWYDYYRDRKIFLYNESFIAATPSTQTTIEDLKNGKRKTTYEQFAKICELLQNTILPFYKIAELTDACVNQVFSIYNKSYFTEITKDMEFKIRSNKGENAVNAKLTEEDVENIMQEMLNGAYSADLARKYNVSSSTINDIKHHRIWKGLTDGVEFTYNKKQVDNSKPVLQYDINGNFIAEYSSAREADKATGIGYRMISRVCNGDRPYTHGFIFKFKIQQHD